MNRVYHLLNVFTRENESFSGNALCVFENGAGLDDATLQAVARQFNLSETTFLYPSERATARVRIFTPFEELPFAGHPTLGTAHVLRMLHGSDALTLEMAAGVIPVEVIGDHWTLTAEPAAHRPAEMSVDVIAEALSLGESDVAGMPLWVSTGTEQLLVPVRSAEALQRANPAGDLLDRIRSSQGRSQVAVFHDPGDDSVALRFFFRKTSGFDEDPATGSACANLGGWYLANGRAPVSRTVFQGDHLGRPSTLHLRLESDGTIRVAGDVAYLGRGEISV